jgi:uncharacterized protein (UPF0332 family)
MKEFSMGFNKSGLINYRLKMANESIADAEAALKNNSLHMAENRIYYSAFYAISALALKNGFSTKKPLNLLGGLT